MSLYNDREAELLKIMKHSLYDHDWHSRCIIFALVQYCKNILAIQFSKDNENSVYEAQKVNELAVYSANDV